VAFAAASPPTPTPAVEPPEWSEKREDQNKYFRYQQSEQQRVYARSQEAAAWSQHRSQERAAVLPACGLLISVGIAFVAVTLFIVAARAEAAGLDTGSPAIGRFARWMPGVAALVCATVIASVSAPDTRPATTPPGTGPSMYGAPQMPPIGFGPTQQVG
jgi:hypothetical protein